MTWYAENPVLRARQLVTDLLVLLWVALWLRLGLWLHDALQRLEAPGRGLQDAGNRLAGGLGGAADRARDVPLVGGTLGDPLTSAAGAGRVLAAAGVEQQHVVERLALVLGLLVAVLPVAWMLARWLPGRLHWAREAAAAAQLRGDPDLFALRAAATLPLSELARLGPDPVGRWRRGEPGATQALADLELRRLGLLVPGRPVRSYGG